MFKKYVVFAVLLVAMSLAALGPVTPAAPTAQAQTDLEIIWFDWPPCAALSELAASYPDADVTVNCVPIGQWHDQIFTDFAAEGGADLTIVDSQWTGEAVQGGHLVDLTEWMQENIEIDDYIPAALAAYGEYPAGSGTYYGVPAMADVQLLVYREDLFADAGFEAPGSWTELLEQAEYFKDSDVIDNGWVWFWCGTEACLDVLQNAWDQIAWSFGGELWDPETYQVEGVLNSPENVAAVEFARELYLAGPEGAGNYQYGDVIEAMCNGTAAMTAIWVGILPSFQDPEACAQAENLAYAVPPGEDEHILQLGGMGMNVSSYGNTEAALDFLAWFESQEIQLEWVKLGGYSARISVLASDEFLNAAPYNDLFAEAYALVKDFWNVPEYIDMLIVQGQYLNLAIVGEMGAQEALDEIAAAHQEILDEAYPDGPPQ